MFKCKWIIGGIVLTVLAVCLMGMQARKDYWNQMHRQSYTNAIAIYSTGVAGLTDYVLISDLTLRSGKSLIIDSVVFSSANANSLFFSDVGSADVGYGYYRVPANGTIIDRDIVLKLTAGAALYATTADVAEICVQYRVE